MSGVVTQRPASAWESAGSQYEYKVVTMRASLGRAAVRQALTDEAEYGRWELARSVVYVGGGRKVWLRRKIIRVTRTV